MRAGLGPAGNAHLGVLGGARYLDAANSSVTLRARHTAASVRVSEGARRMIG